jgi:hypothetical protein
MISCGRGPCRCAAAVDLGAGHRQPLLASLLGMAARRTGTRETMRSVQAARALRR